MSLNTVSLHPDSPPPPQTTPAPTPTAEPSIPLPSKTQDPSNYAESQQFLHSLLFKTLRIAIRDRDRFFTGSFRCVDRDANVILSNAFEHRLPSASATASTVESVTTVGVAQTSSARGDRGSAETSSSVDVDSAGRSSDAGAEPPSILARDTASKPQTTLRAAIETSLSRGEEVTKSSHGVMSRFMGFIVIPGHEIVKVELEERGRGGVGSDGSSSVRMPIRGEGDTEVLTGDVFGSREDEELTIRTKD